MNALPKLLLETVMVAAAATSFALVANALSPDGLDLGRDYFQGRTAPPEPVRAAPTAAADSAAAPSATVVDAAVRARLEAHGLAVVEHDEAVALFRDPLREAGAYVFVDARAEPAYLEGHVPGAIQHDQYRYESTIDEVMALCGTADRVVVYCNGQDCTDSELAALQLRNFGLDPAKIGVYAGGITAWRAAGLPVDRGPRGGTPGGGHDGG